MTQDNLETLDTAGAGGRKLDRNIASGKYVDDDGLHNDVVIPVEVDVPSEYPLGSFWLSKDAEYDWFDRNTFYERRESTKGNSNSTSINPSSNYSSSQRFHASLKSKASIIGLPTAFVDTKRRTCKPTNIRLFPKRSNQSAGKSMVSVAEPGSPKVSCMGRVRSKRGRRRRSNSSRRSDKNPCEKAMIDREKRTTGFCSWLISMLRAKKAHRKTDRLSDSGKVEEPDVVLDPPRNSVGMKVLDNRASIEAETPGLGGMKRFSSGRRSGSWTADEFNQAVSVPLDCGPTRGSHHE